MQIRFGQLTYHSSVSPEQQVELEKVSRPMASIWQYLDRQGVDITVSRNEDRVELKASAKDYNETLTASASCENRNDLALFSEAATYGMMIAQDKAAQAAARRATELYDQGVSVGQSSPGNYHGWMTPPGPF